LHEHRWPDRGAPDPDVRAEIAKEKFVGLAVVVDEGRIAWSKGDGCADRENGVSVDPASTHLSRSASAGL
jgi:hypothetical protein